MKMIKVLYVVVTGLVISVGIVVASGAGSFSEIPEASSHSVRTLVVGRASDKGKERAGFSKETLRLLSDRVSVLDLPRTATNVRYITGNRASFSVNNECFLSVLSYKRDSLSFAVVNCR